MDLEDKARELEALTSVSIDDSSLLMRKLLMSCDSEGNSLLHYAIAKDNLPLMRTILKLISDQTANRALLNHLFSANNIGETPLHLAAKSNSWAVNDVLKVVERESGLLGRNAIVRLIGPNKDGDTPVILAGDEGLTVAVNRIFDFIFANMTLIGQHHLNEQLEIVKISNRNIDSPVKKGALKLLKSMFTCNFDNWTDSLKRCIDVFHLIQLFI